MKSGLLLIGIFIVTKEEKTCVALKDKFPDEILEIVTFRNETTVLIRKEKLLDIMNYLHDEPEENYNFLSDITAVDWFQRKPRFDIVYQLRSFSSGAEIRLKIQTDDNAPIATVSHIWQTANWLEREVYDLFGIEFTNHPDLRRILTPEHWEEHPLRKDYPLTGKNEPLLFPSGEDFISEN